MSAIRPASERLKRAELTSTVGAAVLGAGIALLLGDVLRPHAMVISAVGLVTHAWGMTDKHRLETHAGEAQPRWLAWVYWGCWASLLGLAGYVLATAL
jgi:hypothetical protein